MKKVYIRKHKRHINEEHLYRKNQKTDDELYRDIAEARSFFTENFGENIASFTKYKGTGHMERIVTFVIHSGAKDGDGNFPFRVFKMFSFPGKCNIVFYLSSGSAGKEKLGVSSRKWYPIFGLYITPENYDGLSKHWLCKGGIKQMTQKPIYGSRVIEEIKKLMDSHFSDTSYLESIKNGYVDAMKRLRNEIYRIHTTTKKPSDIDLSCLYDPSTKTFYCPNSNLENTGMYGSGVFIDGKGNDGRPLLYGAKIMKDVADTMKKAAYYTIKNRMDVNMNTEVLDTNDNGRIKEVIYKLSSLTDGY